MANGKMYIGNYHGKKWFDDSVKPHHAEIRKAREASPKTDGGTPVTTVGMAMASPIIGGNYARLGDN